MLAQLFLAPDPESEVTAGGATARSAISLTGIGSDAAGAASTGATLPHAFVPASVSFEASAGELSQALVAVSFEIAGVSQAEDSVVGIEEVVTSLGAPLVVACPPLPPLKLPRPRSEPPRPPRPPRELSMPPLPRPPRVANAGLSAAPAVEKPSVALERALSLGFFTSANCDTFPSVMRSTARGRSPLASSRAKTRSTSVQSGNMSVSMLSSEEYFFFISPSSP